MGCQGAVSGLELFRRAGIAGGFYVKVLDVGTQVGEAPGKVLVVADGDEGGSGKGNAGGVESVGGGLEVNFVPDSGNGEGEVHIVRQERLAGSRVGSGDGPGVGAGGEVRRVDKG